MRFLPNSFSNSPIRGAPTVLCFVIPACGRVMAYATGPTDFCKADPPVSFNGSGDEDTIRSLVNWSYVERPVVDSFLFRSLRALTRAIKAPCEPGSQLPAVTMPVIATSLHK